ncbi:uncharacterized protein LOC102496717 [Tupaia chinensis]|uniref:uncharacterized protein LOC102496717 n=1 Tax=Tupaia chinensis TaxID=246437 RepID=UPI000FFB7364|nr:uncharacterized protein LOC102496717 [Tupaia chinensis]
MRSSLHLDLGTVLDTADDRALKANRTSNAEDGLSPPEEADAHHTGEYQFNTPMWNTNPALLTLPPPFSSPNLKATPQMEMDSRLSVTIQKTNRMRRKEEELRIYTVFGLKKKAAYKSTGKFPEIPRPEPEVSRGGSDKPSDSSLRRNLNLEFSARPRRRDRYPGLHSHAHPPLPQLHPSLSDAGAVPAVAAPGPTRPADLGPRRESGGADDHSAPEAAGEQEERPGELGAVDWAAGGPASDIATWRRACGGKMRAGRRPSFESQLSHDQPADFGQVTSLF